MIDKWYLHISKSDVPYHNIAREAFMLEHAPPHCGIFYLWQNRRTVVIGRNQNAWKECRVAELENAGGFLARRLSGGGAVFHDLGNLCFTFILPKEDYDVGRQTAVLLDALKKRNLAAVMKGRNDLEIDGKKFSGHAYYQGTKNALHHGTFLVNADLSLAQKYLSPSPEKIVSKGVASVKSRIVNLSEFNRLLTIESLNEALIESVEHAYGCTLEPLGDAFFDKTALADREARFAAPEWKYGHSPACSMETSARFDWGGVDLHFDVIEGKVAHLVVFSDSMDEAFIRALPEQLDGSPFRSSAALIEEIEKIKKIAELYHGNEGLFENTKKVLSGNAQGEPS
ncbi:MAG: lipoate--protein ligase [Spirochaetaceae bacterium]|jgi:lipoate-protein ligase A|nr:lipoate--protein ligase [Spirochaetaceae bacterium]